MGLIKTINSLSIKNDNNKENTAKGEAKYWTAEAKAKGLHAYEVLDAFGDFVYDACYDQLGFGIDVFEEIEETNKGASQRFGVSDTIASKTSFLAGLKKLSKVFKSNYK